MTHQIDLLTGDVSGKGGPGPLIPAHAHRSCECGHRHPPTWLTTPNTKGMQRFKDDTKAQKYCTVCECAGFVKASA